MTRPILLVGALVLLQAHAAAADSLAERDAIAYRKRPVDDPVARLTRALGAAQTKIAWDDQHGYLRAVLAALKIPISSQALVFSKTSFQRNQIAPGSPRALYFNDDTYVGWVQSGDVVELASVDPVLGTIFYAVPQRRRDVPHVQRIVDECLQCHESGMTEDVPGLLVRSVWPGRDGLPVLSAGTFRTTHASPLQERWGGWYVTGTHGQQRHMGNVQVSGSEAQPRLDREAGANVTDLSRLIDVKPYLSPHSDIVALMVLEHQVLTQNLITKAGYLARLAIEDNQVMAEALRRPAGKLSDSTRSRVEHAVEPLVEALLLSREAPLTAPIRGTTAFAREFEARGPYDRAGRSLRQFDLGRRLFKHPLSYLIYSPSVTALPPLAREQLWRRLGQILSGRDRGKAFSHLSAPDRRAIVEILRDTRRDLPASFGAP